MAQERRATIHASRGATRAAMVSHVFAVMACATALAGAPEEDAPADAVAAAVAWDAAPTCPTQEVVRRAVADRLGDATPGRPFVATMTARADDVGFRVSIAIDDAGAHSERVLRGASCEELASAAALIVAMTIDPRIRLGTGGRVESGGPEQNVVVPLIVEPSIELADGGASEPEFGPEPERSRPEAQRGVASVPDAAVAAGLPPRSLRFAGRVGVGVGGGPLPAAPSAVVLVAAGLAGRRWRAEVLGRWMSPRSAPSEANPAVGLTAQLWALGVRGCGVFVVGDRIEVPLCAAVLAGLMHARGTGDALRSATAASPWMAVAGGPELIGWVRPRLGLGVATQAHVTLARTQFTTEPSGLAHRAARFGGSAAVVLEIRSP